MNNRIKKLVADSLSGNEVKARRAETKLKSLKNPACIKFLLPYLLRWSGAPDATADRAMNILSSMGENDLVCASLLERLQNGDETVRANAAWALHNVPHPKAIPDLKNCAMHDRNEDVRIWSLHALKALVWQIPSLEKEIFGILRKAVKNSSPGIRCAAYECLSHMKDPRCASLIEGASRDKDITIRKVHAPSWDRHMKSSHGNRDCQGSTQEAP